jgi:E3 ubiquitin-protein ligase BRE1
LKEKEQRITHLSIKQQSEEDIQKLQQLDGTLRQLEQMTSTVSELQGKLDKTRQDWALALGNEQCLKTALEEQQNKFNKRWQELNIAMRPESGENETLEDATSLVSSQRKDEEQRIVQLQHKLNQALENVRQAESTREELKDALTMNESLQEKLEEMKSKYAAAKNSALTSAGSGNVADPTTTKAEATSANLSGSDSNAHGSLPADKVEKLHRDYRRMRKELEAVKASKESVKSRLERAEKERDALMEMNSRMLKQISEKDEMNAKSLSTILHLKSMTEQLTLERENLDQQAKSASQLALAARLATNAKERCAEGVENEKTTLEMLVDDLEIKQAETKKELGRISKEWSEANSKMVSINTEQSNLRKRNDELVDERAAKNKQIQDLVDKLAIAERERREASTESNPLLSNSSGGNASAPLITFSVEQLNTQVSVLKNRLSCPVCHYNDKECILMQCRHMHCKQCVDERLSNRSRKCPTCNLKFSETDVKDIWLGG